MVWVEVPHEFPGEKMGTELGLNGWADLVKQKGRKGCSKGENMLKQSKTGNSCRYLRDRAISLASEEGLCSGNRVRKHRMVWWMGLWRLALEVRLSKDGCHVDSEDIFSYKITGRQKSVCSDETLVHISLIQHANGTRISGGQW